MVNIWIFFIFWMIANLILQVKRVVFKGSFSNGRASQVKIKFFGSPDSIPCRYLFMSSMLLWFWTVTFVLLSASSKGQTIYFRFARSLSKAWLRLCWRTETDSDYDLCPCLDSLHLRVIFRLSSFSAVSYFGRFHSQDYFYECCQLLPSVQSEVVVCLP